MSHHHARKSAHAAPRYKTGRAPMASITGPKIALPSGMVPPKAINHKAMTRARISTSSLLWNTVIIDVVVPKYATPRKKPVMNASGVPRTEAKAIMEIANARNPRRVSVRLSNGARTVPIASAPTSAPVPHVAQPFICDSFRFNAKCQVCNCGE